MSENIPEIRFKYFNKGWEPRKLGDLLTEVKRPIKMQDELQYQLVTVKRRNNGIVSRGYFKGKEVLVKNYFELKTGDYLISKRQVVHGANGIVPDNLDGAVVSNEYLVSTGNNNITTDFLTILSKLPQMYKMFFLSSYGIDIEKLVFNVEDWKKRKINIPLLDEQNTLSAFFNILDKNIDLHQHALDLLIQRKRAFFQEMLPKKGESVPEVRFRTFDVKWEEKNIGDIAILKNGYTFRSETYHPSGEYKIITIRNVTDNRYVNIDDTSKVLDLPDNIKDHQLLEMGNILVSMTGNVGRVSIVNNNNTLLNQRVGLIAVDESLVYKEFIFQIISDSRFELDMINKGQGAAQLNISKSDIQLYSFYIPPIEEQKKIGNFFKQLDDSINLQEQKIESLKQMKKAFLQKMFI